MILKLIAVSRVKNEIDIIESFVRHHIKIFDTIIIMDDGSDDGTYEVLETLKNEGNPIIVTRNSSIGFDQSYYVSKLVAQAIYELGADWVFPLDADEFIEPPLNSPLQSVLLAWGPRLMHIGWSNFVWLRDKINHNEINPVLRLVHRLPSRTDHPKIAIPASAIRHKDFSVDTGSHRLFIECRLQDIDICTDLQLCHFPVREQNQFITKVAISYLQMRSWPRYSLGVGIQYDNPFDTLKTGLADFEASMEAASLRYSVVDGLICSEEYVEAPFRYQGGSLTLTQAARPFLSNILQHAEAMAAKLKYYSIENSNMQSMVDDLTHRLAISDQSLFIERSNFISIEQELDKKSLEVNELALAYKQSEIAIVNIGKSLSWRVTSPIRFCGRLMLKMNSHLLRFQRSDA